MVKSMFTKFAIVFVLVVMAVMQMVVNGNGRDLKGNQSQQ